MNELTPTQIADTWAGPAGLAAVIVLYTLVYLIASLYEITWRDDADPREDEK